jgi:hypothetical protein
MATLVDPPTYDRKTLRVRALQIVAGKTEQLIRKAAGCSRSKCAWPVERPNPIPHILNGL